VNIGILLAAVYVTLGNRVTEHYFIQSVILIDICVFLFLGIKHELLLICVVWLIGALVYDFYITSYQLKPLMKSIFIPTDDI
jgi:hypothetical protein